MAKYVSTNTNDKKIILMEPPFCRLYQDDYSFGLYPLALGYLAGAVLKDTKWNVQTYNADFCHDINPISLEFMIGQGYSNYLAALKDPTASIWQEIREVLADFRPDVVGISAKTQTLASAAMVARIAKEMDPKVTVVVGGPHPSMVGGQVLKDYPQMDVAVRGEGEATLVDLLQALEQDRDLASVRGICFRRNGAVVDNPPREMIADLDSLPFPYATAPQVLRDHALYPPRAYRDILALRGCPFNCMYCGSRQIWTRKVRFRSVGNVVAEMKGLWSLGLESIRFSDDTFGVSKRYIKELCAAIATELPGMTWHCELHTKLVDPEVLAIMKRSGCRRIQLGVESGNNQVLKAMRKGVTIDKTLRACRMIKKAGIHLEGFFMIGFPQETEESLADTVRAMKKSGCDSIIYSIFTPYPGTEMFSFCQDHDLIPDDFDPCLYNHQSPANYFCMNISPERFRQLAARVERMVDRYNRIRRRRRQRRDKLRHGLNSFTAKARRAIELGPVETLRRLWARR